MGGNGGLRKPGAQEDLAGAHADFQRVILFGEVAFGRLQPLEDVAAYRMSEGLDDGVDIHGVIVAYRHVANLISSLSDIQIVCSDSLHQPLRCVVSAKLAG